jgi:hypothetical protein
MLLFLRTCLLLLLLRSIIHGFSRSARMHPKSLIGFALKNIAYGTCFSIPNGQAVNNAFVHLNDCEDDSSLWTQAESDLLVWS